MDDYDIKSEIESYRIENENLKRTNEKICVDYELKVDHLKKEIEYKTSSYNNLMTNFVEIQSKLKQSCEDKVNLNQTCQDLSKEKFEVLKKFNSLESDYSTITELISRRENELMNAKNEVHELMTKLEEFKANEIDMKLKERELDYKNREIEKHEEMEQSKSQRLSDDIKHLQQKLLESDRAMFDMRTAHNSAMYEMKVELEKKQNEIKNQKKINEKLKENVSYLEKVYEEKTESLRSALEGRSNVDTLLRKDLSTQKSMTDLFKAERDELVEKQRTFVQTITELQDAFRENCADSTRMKEECEARLEEFEDQVVDLEAKLRQKEKELKDADELLEKFRAKSLSEEDLRAMNPATAAALGALKRGLSLTQMYSEYLQVVSERDELRVERDRLNEHVRTVLEEVEQRAPSLRRQQQERETMELSVSILGRKYERTVEDLAHWREEAGRLSSTNESLSERLRREEQTATDLGMQVRALLVEVEGARGTVVRGVEGCQDARGRAAQARLIVRQAGRRPTAGMGAQEIISQHMVTFRGIGELQAQNKLLLTQVRDLAAMQEAQEALVNDQSMQQVAKRLEDAGKEIDCLREKVQRLKEAERLIERQGHMIRALTALGGHQDLGGLLRLEGSSPVVHAATTAANIVQADGRSAEAVAGLEKEAVLLRETLDHLRTERDQERARTRADEQSLQAQVEDLRAAIGGLQARLETASTRSAVLEQNLVQREAEVQDLREEAASASEECARKTEEARGARTESAHLQERVRALETALEAGRGQTSSLETALATVRRDLVREVAGRVGALEALILQSQTRAAVAPGDGDGDRREVEELRARLRQAGLEARQERARAQAAIEAAQARAGEAAARRDAQEAAAMVPTSLPDSVCVEGPPKVANETHRSPEKREKRDNLEELLEDLTIANATLRKQVDDYQAVLSHSEAQLEKHANLIEQLQTEFQEKMSEERRKKEELEEVLENYQTSHDGLETDLEAARLATEEARREAEEARKEAGLVAETLRAEAAAARSALEEASADLERQRLLAKEASGNYQQELIFHSLESDRLQEVSEQLQRYQGQERDLSQRLREAVAERDRCQGDLARREVAWTEERVSLEAEAAALRSQREGLSQRLVEVNDLVVGLKGMLDPSMGVVVDQAVLQRETDMNEVVLYLRQEKEAAEDARNRLEMELTRLRQDHACLETALETARTALAEERHLAAAEAETRTQHAEVMRRLEAVQMLTESNAMLRADRERAQEEAAAAGRRLAELEGQLEPLRAQVGTISGDLEAAQAAGRALEAERDLWRRRCDSLLERSKQVSPEDFRRISAERDEMEQRLKAAEEECVRLRSNLTTMEMRLEKDLETAARRLEDSQEEARRGQEEARRGQEEHIVTVQRKDQIISQLKDLGRKYKSEKEQLRQEVEGLLARQEAATAQAVVMEIAVQEEEGEQAMRIKILEKQLAQARREVEGLRGNQAAPEEEHVGQTAPCAPTVARVAANVHPVVQKAAAASDHAVQAARQTAEIRPIPAHSQQPAVVVPEAPPVTTSLPANVLQALATSSASGSVPSTTTTTTVIFPRAKRRLDDPGVSMATTSSMTSMEDPAPASKRARAPSPVTVTVTNEEEVGENVTVVNEEVVEEEEEDYEEEEEEAMVGGQETSDQEEESGQDLEGQEGDEDDDEDEEEDDDDEDEDEEALCIDLLSSDDDDDDDNNQHNSGHGNEDDGNHGQDRHHEGGHGDRHGGQPQDYHGPRHHGDAASSDATGGAVPTTNEARLQQDCDLEMARKKIEPITWGEGRGGLQGGPSQAGAYGIPQLGQPIKMRPQAVFGGLRRKAGLPHARRTFQYGGQRLGGRGRLAQAFPRR